MRKTIWKQMLQIAGMNNEQIEKIDLEGLSIHELNGRDIKNIVKRSCATAKGDKTELTTEIVMEQALDYSTES